MKTKNLKIIFFLLFINIFFINELKSQYFKQPIPTPYVCDYIGTIKIIGYNASQGDEIAFYDPDGVICGVFVLKKDGVFGMVHIYGDDPTTMIDEGAKSHDKLEVKIWDSKKNILYSNKNIFLKPLIIGGTASPSEIPPKWQTNGIYAVEISVLLAGDINLNFKLDLGDAFILIEKLSLNQINKNN